MKREELIKAAQVADYQTLRASGWLAVFEALEGWWPGRLNVEDMALYIDALEDIEAVDVMEALRALRAQQFRPSPSELFRRHGGHDVQSEGSPPGRHGEPPREDQTPRTYAEVRRRISAGHRVCECSPRSPQMDIDAQGVLTCPDCGSLEMGQAEAATNLDDDSRLPPPEIEAIARWARELQKERVEAGKPPSRLLTRIGSGDVGAIGALAQTHGLAISEDHKPLDF